MKVYKHDDGHLVFQAHVGSGTYAGREFKLGVTASPDGMLLGMPVFTFDDTRETVVFELADLLPMAANAETD